ncbi:MAG: biopolymer transporter ExbD [Hyphomicrobiales bacterium]|uniref:biopolymer transporter ExbD n=1 Tax=Shimia thalassica TaxID=1715693 RepID=UPI00329704E4
MDFTPPPKRPRGESIVPMINVVFLLLVFFLMTAHIAPPDPFEVVRPVASEAMEPETKVSLYVGHEGALQYEDHKGEAVYSELAGIAETEPVLQIRIDAKLDGDVLAQVMKKLTAAGLSRIEVVVEAQ